MAKIKISQRCEDSHAIIEKVDGKRRVKYLVDKFAVGEVHEIGSPIMPQTRAEDLIELGVAELVDE